MVMAHPREDVVLILFTSPGGVKPVRGRGAGGDSTQRPLREQMENMSNRPRVVTVTKFTASDGTLLGYTTPAHVRRRLLDHIDKGDVPPFEGDSADFEMVKEPGKPWPRWRIIRRV